MIEKELKNILEKRKKELTPQAKDLIKNNPNLINILASSLQANIENNEDNEDDVVGLFTDAVYELSVEV